MLITVKFWYTTLANVAWSEYVPNIGHTRNYCFLNASYLNVSRLIKVHYVKQTQSLFTSFSLLLIFQITEFNVVQYTAI